MSEKEKELMQSIAALTASLPPGTDEIAVLAGNLLEMGKKIGKAQAEKEAAEKEKESRTA